MDRSSKKEKLSSQEKVVITDSSNFQFHAAYLAYLEAYNKTTDSEAKKYLNQNIIALQRNEIDYRTFYRNINQYRSIDRAQCQSKSSIRTQSKREWHNRMRKIERERRYENK